MSRRRRLRGSTFHNVRRPQLHFQWRRRVRPRVFTRERTERSGQNRTGGTTKTVSPRLNHLFQPHCDILPPTFRWKFCLDDSFFWETCILLPVSWVCSVLTLSFFPTVVFACALLFDTSEHFRRLHTETMWHKVVLWVKHVAVDKWKPATSGDSCYYSGSDVVENNRR